MVHADTFDRYQNGLDSKSIGKKKERVKNVLFLARVTSKSRAWVSFFWIMPHIV